jgi:hypothetical protein
MISAVIMVHGILAAVLQFGRSMLDLGVVLAAVVVHKLYIIPMPAVATGIIHQLAVIRTPAVIHTTGG